MCLSEGFKTTFWRTSKMKKAILQASTALGLLVGSFGTSSAAPIVINFDNLASGTTVTNQYAGVTFSNARTINVVPVSNPNAIRALNGSYQPQVGNPIVATFATFASMVSITGSDVGGNGIRIDAYDAAVGGNLIDFESFIGSGGGVGTIHTLSVAAAGIGRVEFYQPLSGAGDGVVWDDFTFDAASSEISEPAAIAVLGFGLLGLGYARRKRAA